MKELKDIIVDQHIKIPFFLDNNKYVFFNNVLLSKSPRQLKTLCLKTFKQGRICRYYDDNIYNSQSCMSEYFTFEEYDYEDINNPLSICGAIFLPFESNSYTVVEYSNFIWLDNKISNEELNKRFHTKIFKYPVELKTKELLMFL